MNLNNIYEGLLLGEGNNNYFVIFRVSDVLLWTPTYGRAKARWPARTYIQQLCNDTGRSPEDLTEAMNDMEKRHDMMMMIDRQFLSPDSFTVATVSFLTKDLIQNTIKLPLGSSVD